jgi:hypothetical protein
MLVPPPRWANVPASVQQQGRPDPGLTLIGELSAQVVLRCSNRMRLTYLAGRVEAANSHVQPAACSQPCNCQEKENDHVA